VIDVRHVLEIVESYKEPLWFICVFHGEQVSFLVNVNSYLFIVPRRLRCLKTEW
jgi:hypothetical protein